MKFEPAAFDPFVDPDYIKKEKSRARKLRDTPWWKRKCSSGRCHYCQATFKPYELTMDHVIPLARGGSSTRENIVPCCKDCNSKKKNLIPAEWQDYLDALASR